jgi:hypothetical protein
MILLAYLSSFLLKRSWFCVFKYFFHNSFFYSKFSKTLVKQFGLGANSNKKRKKRCQLEFTS